METRPWMIGMLLIIAANLVHVLPQSNMVVATLCLCGIGVWIHGAAMYIVKELKK